jgi:hypothetical protein
MCEFLCCWGRASARSRRPSEPAERCNPHEIHCPPPLPSPSNPFLLIRRKLGIHIPTPSPNTSDHIPHPPPSLIPRIYLLQRTTERERRDEAVVAAAAEKVDVCWRRGWDEVLRVCNRVFEECFHRYVCGRRSASQRRERIQLGRTCGFR